MVPVKAKMQNGFTLVELAIVLMIIGLLIGGVLRGKELLANARSAATVQQLKSYESAVATFQGTYNSFPGDIVNAGNRIPGCNASNLCISGDGNGIVGPLNPGQGHKQNEPWQLVSPAIDQEGSQFWKHLALTHLVSGVNPAATQPVIGVSHPLSKLEGGLGGGGFYVRYTNFNVPGYPIWTGHIAVMTRSLFSTASEETPMRVSLVDRKMDDGLAFAGDVRAISADWMVGCGNPNAGTNGPSGYAESSELATCRMAVKIF